MFFRYYFRFDTPILITFIDLFGELIFEHGQQRIQKEESGATKERERIEFQDCKTIKQE